MSVMPGSKNSTPGRLQPESIELIFRTLDRLYPNKFRQTAMDKAARTVWFAALSHAGITDAMVETGLANCVELPWPPSAGEFIKACVPSPEACGLPNVQAVMHEIFAAAHSGKTWDECEWTHPVMYHVAKQLTIAQLRGSDVEKSISYIYDTLRRRLNAGEDLALPVRRALPPAQRCSEEAAKGWIKKARDILRGRTQQ